MSLKDKKIAFALTGSFYAYKNVIKKIDELKKQKTKIIPIMSFNSYTLDIKIENRLEYIQKIEKICEQKIIHTIEMAKNLKDIDLIIIAPCTANTISKLACNVIDTPVLTAAMEVLRYQKPLVLAPVCINGLGESAENIGKLLNRKNYYFVPFRQDNPITKPRSISFDPQYIIKTIKYALNNEQISPILL